MDYKNILLNNGFIGNSLSQKIVPSTIEFTGIGSRMAEAFMQT